MMNNLDPARNTKLDHWGEGPWINEPDFDRFEHAGLECEIFRHYCFQGKDDNYIGAGCLQGYVKIPNNHPWYGKDLQHTPSLNVHGGVTFSHVYSNGHWIGFDCAGEGDIVPFMNKIMDGKDSTVRKTAKAYLATYKTWDFVVKETKKLAEQVKEKENEL